MVFFSPPTHGFPFPYEIIDKIVHKHLCLNPSVAEDRTCIKALSSSSPILRDICQRILFRDVTFNFQRKDALVRVGKFISLIHKNPRLATFVRDLAICDCATPFHRLDQRIGEILLRAPATNFYTYEEMLDEARYQVLLDGADDAGAHLVSCLLKMGGLQQFRATFLYLPRRWERISTHFQEFFTYSVRRPNLETLILEGIQGVPSDLLMKFRRLKRLELYNISIDTTALLPPIDTIEKPVDLYKLRLKLNCLSLGSVTTYGSGGPGGELIQFWQQNTFNSTDDVSLTFPRKIDISFTDNSASNFGRLAVLRSSLGLEELYFRTSLMGANEIWLDAAKIGKAPTHPVHNYTSLYKWFTSHKLVQPSDVAQLYSLKSLGFSVSHWGMPNLELQWALSILQNVPTNSLEEINLRIVMTKFWGGHPNPILSFAENAGLIIGPWSHELYQDKYSGLQCFNLSMTSPVWDKSVKKEEVNQLIYTVLGEFPLSTFKRRKTIISMDFYIIVSDDHALRVHIEK